MTDNLVFQRGVDSENNVIEVVGTSFYRKESTGFANSVADVQAANLQRAPTYMFAQARATAEKNDPIWSNWHDTNAEVDTVLDKDNILGNGAGKLYVVDFQRGGFFVNDHSRVHSTVTEDKLRNGAMPLDQEEVNELLGYIANDDRAALKQKGWLQGSDGANYAFKTVEEFIDASNVEGFLRNTPGYVVVTLAEKAMAESSGYKAISEMLHNPRLQIRSGGKAALKGMLDQAQSFGWTQFGSHTDGYKNANSGRAVVLDDGSDGVNGNSYLVINGRSVGVAPEALEARAKIVGPVPAQVVEAQPAISEDSGIVQPTLDQILAYSRTHISEVGFPAFEEGFRKLYE